ncbi:hypothetical protein N7530_012612 [Penicillium desertorum]|uniref:Uncharacterized protein n=1 Tax=Penicillium desertorum TaxID=1303715 RepID=A0A9W9WFP1_9EURO|nr:hypothetical protein N7530_012612 [Penicillium desertorum]
MKRYDSVPVSDLTLKEVERSLRLEYDAHDLEMKNVQPLALPPHLADSVSTPRGQHPDMTYGLARLLKGFRRTNGWNRNHFANGFF